MCVCVCPEARYNWKLTPSTSLFFLLLITTHLALRAKIQAHLRVPAYIPYLYWRYPAILETHHLNTFTIWLNTSVIFLPDARLTRRIRLITQGDFRDAKSFSPPLSNPSLLYITAQLYTEYVQFFARSANAAVNIGDMSPISRKTYCRPTTLQSKWKAKACSPEYVNVKCLAFSCRNQKRRISYVQFLYVECG